MTTHVVTMIPEACAIFCDYGLKFHEILSEILLSNGKPGLRGSGWHKVVFTLNFPSFNTPNLHFYG